MSRHRLVRSFNSDGTATLEGGEVMQVVVAQSGALGVVKHTPEHVTSQLDQAPQHGVPPGVAPPGYFDTSGLDQA